MSPALWGAVAGGVLAGINMLVLRAVAEGIEKKSKGNESQRLVGILKAVALADLVVFPVLGYFIGPIVL